MTLASVLTPAANGPIVSFAFCGWGGGRSNLWRDEKADRWSSSIRKKFEFNRKSPLAPDQERNAQLEFAAGICDNVLSELKQAHPGGSLTAQPHSLCRCGVLVSRAIDLRLPKP